MASTVNELVKALIDASGLGGIPSRLAEADREDEPPYVLYHLSDGNDDVLLTGVSGLIFRRYLVVFCDTDAAQAESLADTFAAYINTLDVNHVVDTFVIQSAIANEVSDEERPEIVSDVFLYYFTKQLTLVIGRNV